MGTPGGKPMEMRPEELRSGGKKIGHAGDDLQKVLQTLSSALDTEGECWGNDEAGQNFAKDYVKASKDVNEAMKKLADGLGQIKTNVIQTADDTEARDTEQAQNISKIRPA